ncbi:MAG: NAD(P)-binding domain-containing protein, partial [Candidatus Odinarchaeia archaeon]
MISVVGLGMAGLPLAAIIADNGFKVIGVDLDKKRCELINNGVNPIKEEAELTDLISKHGGKNLIATTNYMEAADCNVFIIIVPLFIDNNFLPDFTNLKNAVQNVGKILKKGDLV